MHELRQYPACKDSGVSWLGLIPQHWTLRRTKTLLRERSEKGHPDEPLLAATQTKGVVRKERYENRTVLALKDLHLLKLVRVGDFVISLRSFQGGIEYARDQGIISPAYTVLYTDDHITHDYLAWLFKSRPYIDNLRLYVTGIRQGQNLDYEKLSRSVLPLPSVDDQLAIVRFLNHVDRSIRRYILAKQKLITLLEEQKRAIINSAVTCGLNSHEGTKPSSIDTLENIPSSWQVRPLIRSCTERSDYRGATPTKTESGVFLVTAKNIRPGWIDYETSKEYVDPKEYDWIMRRGRPEIGDLLFTTEAPLGNFALVDREDIALAQRVIRFRLDRRLALPQFALYSVRSPYFQNQLLRRATGSTALGIKASKLPQLLLALPPVEEQRHITDWIASETATLEGGIERARDGVSLLLEYRTRLIADVVTGKLDVRKAAAGLPYEVEGVEELPLADALVDEGNPELASEELAEEEVIS